jgi:glyoxylase-like metal-dependent hydrolase (beta-lactamase superfamily II)
VSTPIPFVTLEPPQYGAVVEVLPGVQRVIAHNPGKFTYHGTGTYIVGDRDVVVVDPGPALDSHRDALAAALADRTVRAILVTHCHADHSPLAAWLRADSGAPTVGFGPHGEIDRTLFDDDTPVEESIDLDFVPDIAAVDGDTMASLPGITLRAVHTPGHTSNHLCVEWAEAKALFTGDHVMGWSTTVVAPPDGDMRAYIDSLRRVAGRDDAVLLPTHGAPVSAPRPLVAALVAHRLEREAQVLAEVRGGVGEVAAIVAVLYADVREELHKPAARSVLAHLRKLEADGLVVADGSAWRAV